MPRLNTFRSEDEYPGTLRIERRVPNVVEVYYVPSVERIDRSGGWMVKQRI